MSVENQLFQFIVGPDSDGDGLVDAWEANGYDPDGDGVVDIDLPAMGADPMHKDLFWEVDWMQGHEPQRHDIVAIKQAFAQAPVDAGGTSNPDGQLGINVWVDAGNLSDANAGEDGAGVGSCGDGVDNGGADGIDAADPDCLVGDDFGGGNEVPTSSIGNLGSDDNGNGMADFYEVKGANFDAVRALVFRYHLSAAPPTTPSGGWGEIGGNDSIEYNHDPGSRTHEWGHNLNLLHGGFENYNCKTSYVSVMNYDHQFGTWRNSGFAGQDLNGDGMDDRMIVDFSPPRFPGGRGGPLPKLQEDNLDEALILDPTDPANQAAFTDANGDKIRSALDTGNNYNGDSPPDTVDSGLAVNIDTSDSVTGVPKACTNTGLTSDPPGIVWYDDWSNMSLAFNHFAESADGPINPVTEPEPTLSELLELQIAFNTTDLAISKSIDPSQVEAGDNFDYRLGIANEGPNPAEAVRVVDTLPANVSVIASPADCVEAPVGTLTCDLAGLISGASSEIVLTVGTADVCVGGVPSELVNEATVSNVSPMAGPDSDPADNEAAHEFTPVDTTRRGSGTRVAIIARATPSEPGPLPSIAIAIDLEIDPEKIMKRTLCVAALMLFLIPAAHAARDYNSSRSNKSSSAEPEETEILLEDARADAMAVVKQRVANDQQDGYRGKYRVVVEAHVALERADEDKK